MDGRPVLDDFTSYPLTDIGSSKLYADMFKNELRFVREIGLYFYYNGKVWIKDVGSIFAKRLAKKFAILMVENSNDIQDDKSRKMFVVLRSIQNPPMFQNFNQNKVKMTVVRASQKVRRKK